MVRQSRIAAKHTSRIDLERGTFQSCSLFPDHNDQAQGDIERRLDLCEVRVPSNFVDIRGQGELLIALLSTFIVP